MAKPNRKVVEPMILYKMAVLVKRPVLVAAYLTYFTTEPPPQHDLLISNTYISTKTPLN